MEDESVSVAHNGSELKVSSQRRGALDCEDIPGVGRKRVKMRDLESGLLNPGTNTHNSIFLRSKETIDESHFGENKISQAMEEPVTMNSKAEQEGGNETHALPLLVDPVSVSSLDLNSQICSADNSLNSEKSCIANNSACRDAAPSAKDSNKSFLLSKNKDQEINSVASRGTGLDLNVEDVSSSMNPDPFYPYKNHNHLKSRDVWECGNSTGLLEGKDPLVLWKEMKQNGFLSSSHGGIPMPKQRVRKSKNDMLKKKMELAKKEQVDRFTKIAGPSGLLNELNPGIINHVRNSKQVHSIIEALVRSEKDENARVGNKHESQFQSRTIDIADRKKDPENANDSEMNCLTVSHEAGSLNTSSLSKQTLRYPVLLNKSHFLSSVDKDDNSCAVMKRICGKNSSTSHSTTKVEDDILALKLSSSATMAAEATSSLSHGESPNLTSITPLSMKAATVASRWLELLQQDIKGRLAALRRSKKRVRAVIHTELPFLMSKEFMSNEENDPCIVKNSCVDSSNQASADMHQARWSTLFDQMDKALSEEEKQLESWLNQVKDMQMHCEWGLQPGPWNAPRGSQQPGVLEQNISSEILDESQKDLAIHAAAASIYSTCNFLFSMENVSCF